jgi:hypothetical protein
MSKQNTNTTNTTVRQENEFPFERVNYRLLLIGMAIIFIGFLLMVGGGTDNPNEFNEKELFSPRRITVAPLIVLAGYVFIIYAIMKKSPAQEK